MQTPTTALSSELQTRLVSVLDYLGSAVKNSADFAIEQAPAVAREVVTYGAVTGWAGVVLMCVLAFSCARAALWVMKLHDIDEAEHKKKHEGSKYEPEFDSFGYGLLILCCIGAATVCLCFACFKFAPQAIKATWAPRVYLIEWTADKLK